MHRPLAVLAVVLAAAVAGCSAGALDSSSQPPTPSAETVPDPAPPTDAPLAFDGVDLAATLVPDADFAPADPDDWGEWTTEARDELLPVLDPAVFADAPCVDAVAVFAEHELEDVVRGGHTYRDELVTAALVARADSAESAEEALDALAAAAAACADDASTDAALGPAQDLVGGDATAIAVADLAAGAMEPTVMAFTTVDEVIVGIVCWTSTSEDVERNADYLQQQVDALEAASA